jgi:hypothetical protein
MFEPRRLTTLWAAMSCYRDSFTIFIAIKSKVKENFLTAAMLSYIVQNQACTFLEVLLRLHRFRILNCQYSGFRLKCLAINHRNGKR